MTRRIVLVRHGPSAHTESPGWIDAAGVYRWREAYDAAGILAQSAPPAELVATTYQYMGLLPSERPPSWYDPGRFWSGDGLELVPPFALGGEIAVSVPAP